MYVAGVPIAVHGERRMEVNVKLFFPIGPLSVTSVFVSNLFIATVQAVVLGEVTGMTRPMYVCMYVCQLCGKSLGDCLWYSKLCFVQCHRHAPHTHISHIT